MARRIEMSIELTKIDKNKIREKDGRKYYDIVAIETPNGKYGQWMILEKQSKEEREDKSKKGTILGNGKNYGWGESSNAGTSGSKPSPSTSIDDW